MDNNRSHYLDNTFEISTRGSRKLLLSFAMDLDGKLSAFPDDTFIKPLYDEFHTKFMTYWSKFSAYSLSKGSLHSSTVALSKLFHKLSPKQITAVDVAVQMVFPYDTPEYTGLFPDGHKPFYSGERALRLTALKVLALAMREYPGLVNVSDIVSDIAGEIELKMSEQNKNHAKMIAAAEELEKERISLATYIYKMLSAFMCRYYDNPSEICRFFNFNMLKRQVSEKETELECRAEAGETVTIVQSDFNRDSIFVIENTGASDLEFCFAGHAGESNPDQGITVPPGAVTELTGRDIGNFRFKFFNVKNLSTAGPGRCLVTLTE